MYAAAKVGRSCTLSLVETVNANERGLGSLIKDEGLNLGLGRVFGPSPVFPTLTFCGVVGLLQVGDDVCGDAWEWLELGGLVLRRTGIMQFFVVR